MFPCFSMVVDVAPVIFYVFLHGNHPDRGDLGRVRANFCFWLTRLARGPWRPGPVFDWSITSARVDPL